MAGYPDIGGNPTARDDDLGASTSRGDGEEARTTLHGPGDVSSGRPVSAEEAEQADTDAIDETPDDLKLGSRRTAGMDEDSGGGRL